MASNPLIEEDSDYASEDDVDFVPGDAPQAGSDESSDGESGADSTQMSKPAKHKRAVANDGEEAEEAEDAGYENSGDEAIIKSGLKKSNKKSKQVAEDEDEGGVGGFVKTRRMAAMATEEWKVLATTEGATVDVDALWASMTSKPMEPATPDEGLEQQQEDGNNATVKAATNDRGLATTVSGSIKSAAAENEDEMIKIQRAYNFAGKVHTEEKLVPRHSAEAKLWLESQAAEKSKSPQKPQDENASKPLRPPKKLRRSLFEPIPENLPQRIDLNLGFSAVRDATRTLTPATVQAKKLNTVEKSKMDWAGFVDKEGIKDELEVAGKAKGSYLDQSDFLARVEHKREEEARRARIKNV